jgi:hypothetical protein
MHTYRVRVGHLEFRIRAHDADEAIALTRRKLAQELPRLYDIIRTMEPSRFQVDHAA